MIIRREQPADREAIARVTQQAFAASEFGHNGEADLVDQLRRAGHDSISLVACVDDEVVGHILLTPARISGEDSDIDGMGLAPMSVLPDHQRQGIGKALISAALEQLEDGERTFVVVLGHPDYYPRIGFQPATDLGITHGFTGIPQAVFFVKFLNGSTADQARNGRVHYVADFGPQHSDAE